MNDELPDLAQQIAYFESRLRNDPGSRVFLPLADLYRRSGELEHARDLLQRGLSGQPGFIAAQVALGLVQAELGDGQAARGVLDRVLMRDPDNLLALRMVLQEAFERGDWSRAREVGERLLRLTPEEATVQERVLEARRQLESASAIDPQEVAALDSPADDAFQAFETPTLAELYLRQGHLDKARAIVERILAAEPDRGEARELLARIEAGVGTSLTPRAASAAAGAAMPQPAEPDGETGQAAKPGRSGGRAASKDARDLDRFRSWLDAAASADS
jgi:tetratricopeptide (TPR) repeat protein